MIFELTRLRFHLRAIDELGFPPGKAGNTLRGALWGGQFCPQPAFQPACSGLRDQPRPFVLRAAHLNGAMIPPEADFHFDAHLFHPAAIPSFIEAVTQMAATGFGPGRGRAQILSVDHNPICIDLAATREPATQIRVTFVTPTELKGDHNLVTRPEFPVLFARLRDRISTLRALYGPGPLAIDFRAMGARSAAIQLTRCDLAWHSLKRHSTRTGQTHPLGGFTGEAEYHGDLTEFLPYLRAGQWTGVGRQTVWGKGEICFQL